MLLATIEFEEGLVESSNIRLQNLIADTSSFEGLDEFDVIESRKKLALNLQYLERNEEVSAIKF